MPSDHAFDADEKIVRFLRLYNENYRPMYLFTRSLVPVEADVEDIMQEVGLALWKKFSDFREKTNFLSWAFRMVRIEVLRMQRKKGRERLYFDEEMIHAVADKLSDRGADDMIRRYESLSECLKKLPGRMRDLICERYFKNVGAVEIANRSNTNVETIYQRLSRSRALLRKCVSQALQR